MDLTKTSKNKLRILISGSSGLVGSHLVPFLSSMGHEVVPLVRKKGIPNSVFWNPGKGQVDLDAFEGFDAVVHLAGKNITSGLWTKHFKKTVFQSRCRDTWLLSHSFLRLKKPPAVFIGASAMGIHGKGFLADLCRDWEKASQGMADAGICVVRTRFGIILSEKGGVLGRLVPLFKLGLGAVLGSGEQKIPWIAIDDLVSGIAHILSNRASSGAYDFVAPEVVSMRTFCKALADHLNRPLLLKIPAFLLRGEMMKEMVLASIEASPEKLLEEGFSFLYPKLKDYLPKGQ